MRFIRNEILRAMDTFTTWGLEHGCYLHMGKQDEQGKQVLTIRPCEEALTDSLGQEKAKPPAYLIFTYQGNIVAQYGESSITAVENLGEEFTGEKAEQLSTARDTMEEILAAITSFHRYIDFMDDLSMREQLEGRMVQPDPEGVLRFLLPQQLDDGVAMILVVDPNGFKLQLEVYIASK